MDLLIVIVSLSVLIYLVYRGVSVLVVSPMMVMITVLCTGDMPAISALSGPFMTASSSFIMNYFPVFLIGAIFGMVMNATGAAHVIANWISDKMGAERSLLAIGAASFVLVFGGVSVFVVVFAILPIAENIFSKNNFPKRLLPAAISAGALPAYVAPGSAQFINTIPMGVFGSNIYSGMVIGWIGVAIWLILANLYITKKVHRAVAAGEGFGHAHKASSHAAHEDRSMPSVPMAFLPIFSIVIGNYFLTQYFETQAARDFYAPFGGVKGVWAITISLILTTLMMLALQWKKMANPIGAVTKGANDALPAIFNVSSQIGYGGVIEQLSVFAVIKAGLLAIPGPKLIAVAIATTVLAGIVGSTSGGVAIFVQTFGTSFAEVARANNISMDVMHRVVVYSASMLDTLPHSGFIITLLGVCGLTHRQSYRELFFVTCFFPMIGTAAIIGFALVGLK